MKERPTGVTILAILEAIGGVLGLLGGCALVGIGGTAGILGAAGGAGEVATAGGLGVVLGIVIVVLSALALAVAYGLWTLKPWGWNLARLLAIANIALNALQIVLPPGGGVFGLLIGIAISGIILYYLYQPEVKGAFSVA